GCKRVAYLESTGTQYIDTGIVPTKELSFDVHFQIPYFPSLYVAGNVFGARQSSTVSEYQVTLYAGGSVGVGRRNSGLGFSNGKEHHIVFNGGDTLVIDGENKQITTSDIDASVGTIVLFAIRSAGSIIQYEKTRIYTCKFGNIRNFVPVLAPDGKACLFNKVPDPEDGKLKLYYNAGSGDFKTNSDE
ncbi:MAG: hypothetical protein ACI4OR_01710, partial [Alphaproteobacteria bacterium]